ncbi:ribosomal protein S5 domain 2-type protein [Microdochium trichocladiopsis]|uniref:Phosphomevalonate kinase n=1 Tax=Microdochium trichocladiopsis TaxID=1682393 RepID=A0A9P8YBU4_9PEZI|nr:ribosomal protein S5 domain 2-type protein [Microdochium trichocladiopsis]KAH7035511.1 ribosomal protein S5 domain 2-type protein [Microdochium trichocladiopsis]
MAPPATPVAVSAPGKVLLAGGYLVLDREYTGLVFGLSARINVVARSIPTSPGVQLNEIVVDSPQFLEAQWRYGYHLAPERGGIKVTQFQVGSNINPNPFVETTLNYALTFISTLAPTNQSFAAARFTVLADNDYYSQPHSSSAADTAKKNPTRFAKFPTTLRDAHKTGLGSSAALVTSLTAALLTYYLSPSDFDLATPQGQRTLHNLAQAAHCAAQGKVGSGFDVAAAVYGSCKYRRFSPSILKGLPEAGKPGFAPALFECVTQAEWDTEIAKDGVSLPAGVALRMCDVDCGSQTVGMVKKVLAWREQDSQAAKTLWDDLQASNEKLGATLKAGEVESISGAVASVRELIRAMGTGSGVPIEPESQTALLDALQSVEGVHNGVVPGAGGFDALALVMKDDAETEKRVKQFLETWSADKGGVVRMLDVKGEMEGVRRESLDQYDGWVQ